MTENFNIGKFRVNIYIKAGIYEELVTLGAYTATTGYINLIGDDTGTEGLTTIIKRTDGATVNVTAKEYTLLNIKLHKIYTAAVGQFNSTILVNAGAKLILDRFEMKLDYASNLPANKYTRPFYILGSLDMRLISGNGPSKIEVNGYQSGMDHLFRVDNGTVTMLGSKASFPKIICSGAMSNFMSLNGGYFGRNTGYSPVLDFTGNMTGKRFGIGGGGRCNVSGLGPEYFPGSIAGTVDAESFSYYK